MSKRAEKAAWKWATENKLDPYSMGRAYGEGYEQAEKDTIERACKWLFAHLPILFNYYNGGFHKNADRSEFIKLFRTQMEDEK